MIPVGGGMVAIPWWRSDPRERFWLEITDRDDVGGDLLAGKYTTQGHTRRSAALVAQVLTGDVVLHYQLVSGEGIIGWSLVSGLPYDSVVVTSGEPVTCAPLDNLRLLAEPVTLSDIRQVEPDVRAVYDHLNATYVGPLHYPFEVGDKRPPRAAQTYLAKFPAELLTVIPGLEDLLQFIPTEPGDDRPVKATGSVHIPRQADPARRNAVERYAVQVVRKRFEDDGYSVADVGAYESWDLTAHLASREIHIEVKGSGADPF
jgi:hypothetical protein